jgi:hypothetical protein
MLIAYLEREFGCDQPITKGTLHVKCNNNTAISRLFFEAFFRKSTTNTVRVLPTKHVTLLAIGQ